MAGIWWALLWLVLTSSSSWAAAAGHESACGGVFTGVSGGVISTPGFPRPPPTPLHCRWLIDASHVRDAAVIVYLTQQYLTSGLSFKEYAYYESEAFNLGARKVVSVTESSAASSSALDSVIIGRAPYLVVEVRLQQLEDNHLRALPHLLSVFGFNITWEAVSSELPQSLQPRRSCSVASCSFAGDCLADAQLQSFYCRCFSGYSGSDCSSGPGCQPGRNPCRNGSKCKQFVGEEASVECICPVDYTGEFCEMKRPNDTQAECAAGRPSCIICDGREEPIPLTAPTTVLPPTDASGHERIRIWAALRLGSKTIKSTSSEEVSKFLHSQLTRKMKAAFNSTSLPKGLRVINMTPIAGLSEPSATEPFEAELELWSRRADAPQIKEILQTFALPATLAIRIEPPLKMLNATVSPRLAVRSGEPFVLSCSAVGSPRLHFRWFKDGITVLGTDGSTSSTVRGSGVLWNRLLPLQARDHYTSLLGADSAKAAHAGVYTCQATDGESLACRSLHLQVWTPPPVIVRPLAVSVPRGTNVTLECLSPGSTRRQASMGERLGFTWTRNHVLLPLAPGRHVWEDLQPAGNVLRLFGVERSAELCCQARGAALAATACARVDVTVPNPDFPHCQADPPWPMTPAGAASRLPCPDGYDGPTGARRFCVLRQPGEVEWEPADFSSCIHQDLVVVERQLDMLAVGIAATSPAEASAAALRWLRSRPTLLPGEPAVPLMVLSRAANAASTLTASSPDGAAVRRRGLEAVDLLLRQPSSLGAYPPSVAALQRLASTLALLPVAEHPETAAAVAVAGAPSPSSASPNHHESDLTELSVNVAPVPPGPQLNEFVFPSQRGDASTWIPDTVRVQVSTPNVSTLAVLAYRDLRAALPARYVLRQEEGGDVELEVNSRVVTVALTGTVNQDIRIEMVLRTLFPVEAMPEDEGWEAACGAASASASSSAWTTAWDLRACAVLPYPVVPNNGSYLGCTCRRTGTFAALLVTRPTSLKAGNSSSSSVMSTAIQSHLVLAGCVSCAFAALLALILLIPQWWSQRTCLLFLKMQFCAATAASAGALLYADTLAVPLLQALPLLALSAPVSALLLIYVELLRPASASLSGSGRVGSTGAPSGTGTGATLVCATSGAPLLAALCGHLAQRWFAVGGAAALVGVVAAAGASLFLLLVLLSAAIARRITVLKAAASVSNMARGKIVLNNRIGLVSRCGALFGCAAAALTATAAYAHAPKRRATQAAVASTGVLLGIAIVVCLIFKPDEPSGLRLLCNRFRRRNSGKTSSGNHGGLSDDGSLTFFTKQDGDAESEGGAPASNQQASEQPVAAPSNITVCVELITDTVQQTQPLPLVVCSVDVESSSPQVMELSQVLEAPVAHQDAAVLSRISQDLDYLLNRVPDDDKQSTLNRRRRIGCIREETEEEGEVTVTES